MPSPLHLTEELRAFRLLSTAIGELLLCGGPDSEVIARGIIPHTCHITSLRYEAAIEQAGLGRRYEAALLEVPIDRLSTLTDDLAKILAITCIGAEVVIRIPCSDVFLDGLTSEKLRASISDLGILIEKIVPIGDPGTCLKMHTPDNREESSGAIAEFIVKGHLHHKPDPDPTKPKTGEEAGVFHGTSLVSVVILTYNKLPFTRACLDSVIRNTDVPYELIVVDNASTDGTAQYLKEMEQQGNIRLIINERNFGYAGGNNIGISATAGEYVLVLNNDTIVTPKYLSNLLSHTTAPDVGIVSPCSNFVKEPQLDRYAFYRNIDELDEYARFFTDTYRGESTDWSPLVGFCLLISRHLVDRIGGFDLRFSYGNYEDDDFSIRANIAGYRTVIANDVFIHHYGRTSWNDIAWKACMLRNWGLFKAKWRLNPLRSMTARYPVHTIVNQKFDYSDHYVPIVPENTETQLLLWKQRLVQENKPDQASATLALLTPKQ